MSEAADHESKTEEATEKKTSDALERGETPVSRDAILAATFLGLFFAANYARQSSWGVVVAMLTNLLDHAGEWRLATRVDAWRLSAGVLTIAGVFLAPIVVIIISAALVGSMAQNLPRPVLKRITPDFSRISPMKGFSRLFSRRGFLEFAKSVAKLGVSAIAAAMALRAVQLDIMASSMIDLPLLVDLLWRIVNRLLLSLVIVTSTFGVADLVMARMSWRRDLRMTRQEIKDELKQSDGDPMVKARLRSMALDRARRRMLDDVSRATLVIANPTHYAIALRYVRSEGGAPIVLAKGQELIALKIRERAESLGIPVIENPPLVRAMYDKLEINRMIPAEYYRAIAEIINFISKQKSGYGVGI